MINNGIISLVFLHEYSKISHQYDSRIVEELFTCKRRVFQAKHHRDRTINYLDDRSKFSVTNQPSVFIRVPRGYFAPPSRDTSASLQAWSHVQNERNRVKRLNVYSRDHDANCIDCSSGEEICHRACSRERRGWQKFSFFAVSLVLHADEK